MRFMMSLLAISMVMLFSCSKDTLTDENPDLKKAKVPIPMKVEICMTSNTSVDSIDVENTPVLGTGRNTKMYQKRLNSMI